MQDADYPLNLALKYMMLYQIHVWTAELDSTKPDCSEGDHAEPNQGLHHQTIAWDLRSFDSTE